MLMLLLPSWAPWILALLVVVAWVGTWALGRAAALGDDIMFRALESPALASQADFLFDPPASNEEEPLVGSLA